MKLLLGFLFLSISNAQAFYALSCTSYASEEKIVFTQDSEETVLRYESWGYEAKKYNLLDKKQILGKPLEKGDTCQATILGPRNSSSRYFKITVLCSNRLGLVFSGNDLVASVEGIGGTSLEMPHIGEVDCVESSL